MGGIDVGSARVGGALAAGLSGVVASLALLIGFGPALGRDGHGKELAVARAYARRQGERKVLQAGMLAAWPRGQWHMTALLERVRAEVDAEGACVIACGRSDSLAVLYARRGFRPVPGQGARTLYRPGVRGADA